MDLYSAQTKLIELFGLKDMTGIVKLTMTMEAREPIRMVIVRETGEVNFEDSSLKTEVLNFVLETEE